jgi:hypothetical protein
MVERTRTAIHKLDHDERNDIDVSESAQIKSVSDKLDTHIRDNDIHNKSVDTKLDELKPLVKLADPEIVDTIKRIIKREEDNVIISQRTAKVVAAITKWILITGGVMAIFWYIISIIFDFRKQ